MQKTNGDQYFRFESATQTIVSVGLNEAVQTLMGKEATEDSGKAFVLTEKILKHINAYAKKHTKKPHTRQTTAIIPNPIAQKRLARLDVEKYGWGIVKTQGTREHPYYADINRISIKEKNHLNLEERIHQLNSGGHLTLIESEIPHPPPEELLAKTKQLVASNIGLFIYNLSLTYCRNCKDAFHDAHLKCPRCSSTNIFTVTRF
jgi:anaerobic ribonucleoside-triphosphate reductase